MYGMVNQAVKKFVETHHGPEAWVQICARAKLDETDFEYMTSYPDAVTYDLVRAVSGHLDVPASQVLEVFGDYWVDFAGKSSLGELIRFAGDSLAERLNGLDEMHERILLSMPHLKPPSFDFEQGEGNVHRLHYHSQRDGLAPMVIGLLHGLSRETGEPISVTHVERKADGADHDIFEIRFET